MKKTALITGGSRGIGAATVEKFAKNGYTVIVNYNKSQQAAKQLADSLNAQGCDVHIFRADMSEPRQIDEIFAYVSTFFKHLDVLVNNAGVSVTGLMQDISTEQLDKLWAVNARAPYLCCKAALPLLVRSNSPAVVNVSSLWGLHGASCEVAYAMTKHAVVGLTKSLSKEWSDSEIAVNCVCPPIVLTDMCANLSQADIDEFCLQNQCKAYSAKQIAEDIFLLATSGKTRTIREEK